MSVPIEGFEGFGRKTEVAGTAIVQGIPGRKGKYTYLNSFGYTDAATQHTLTMMISKGRTTLTTAIAASGTAVVATADPGPTGNAIATGDYIAIKLSDGVSWHFSTVTVVTSTTYTLATALPSDKTASVGAPLAFFGVVGDAAHDDKDYVSNSNSSRKDFPPVDTQGMLCKSTRLDDPIIIYSNNITNAGTLEYATAVYSRVG